MLAAIKAPQYQTTSFSQLNVPGFSCEYVCVCFCVPLPFFVIHLSVSEVLEIY